MSSLAIIQFCYNFHFCPICQIFNFRNFQCYLFFQFYQFCLFLSQFSYIISVHKIVSFVQFSIAQKCRLFFATEFTISNFDFLNKNLNFSTVCKRGIESYYFYSFLLLEEGMGRERFLLWKFSEWKNLKMYHLLYPFCLLDSISILALLSKKAWWVEDNKLIHHTIRKLDTALQWLLLQRPTGVRSLKA